MARIVLLMIVRNESKIIERCIQSCLPIIDGAAIIDTGSTDDTVLKIHSFFELNMPSFPWLCQKKEWKNFGHNRTEAFDIAKECLVDGNFWPGEKVYFLLMDADYILHVEGEFNNQSLTEGSYSIEQVNGNLCYQNIRLIRADLDWKCVCAVHEYWTTGEQHHPKIIKQLWIDDRNDGGHGSKIEKIESYLELLLQSMKEEPDNPRTVFYLAQTYFDLGAWEEATHWYLQRQKMGGYHEEIWYSAYKIAQAYANRKQTNDSIDFIDFSLSWMVKAAADAPHRAEPLVWLATHFRHQSKHALAWMFASAARRLEQPRGLFVEEDAYTTRPLEEQMISGFYIGEKVIGELACEKLLVWKNKPDSFHEYVARNMTFYVQKLWAEGESFLLSPEIRHVLRNYVPCNPSIARHKGRIVTNIRMVNYRQEHGRIYRSVEEDGAIRTKNVLSTLQYIEVPNSWKDEHRRNVFGLEDVRLISFEEELWFTATCCQVPGKSNFVQVVLGSIDKQVIYSLEYEGSVNKHEKNWLPWVKDGHLLLIYSWDPFVVLLPSFDFPEKAICKEIVRKEVPFAARRWRGSAGPISIVGRWVAIVHEVAHMPNENIYMHRFVELDDDFNIVGFSRPFIFEHKGVEYACGMVFFEKDLDNDLSEDIVRITYGVEDCKAKWCDMEAIRVLEMMERVTR